MFETFLQIMLLLVLAAIIMFLIRIFIGPSVTDRIMGLDSLGLALIGFITLIMMLQNTIKYSDVILVLSILSFVSTVVLSKFIERGEIFDDD